MPGSANHSRILFAGDKGRCLDTIQLEILEQSFRSWAKASDRADVRSSRKRILLIFLLIRHTGARLSEVLYLSPADDVDYKNHLVRLCKGEAKSGRPCREVEISETLSSEIRKAFDDLQREDMKTLWIDPGHVRRKFYERA